MHPNSVTASVTTTHLFSHAVSFTTLLHDGNQKYSISSDFCSKTKFL